MARSYLREDSHVLHRHRLALNLTARSFTIRPREHGAIPATSTPPVMPMGQYCCKTARFWLLAATTLATATNLMNPPPGPGPFPGISTLAGGFTQHMSLLTARS